MADAVPVFAVSPEQCPVSCDRFAGAGDAAIRTGRDPATETQQARGILGAVWPAAGRGRAALCQPPLALTGQQLRPPEHVSRAAKAADPARPPDALAAPGGAAALVVCHGRPALGRSVHTGIPQPP